MLIPKFLPDDMPAPTPKRRGAARVPKTPSIRERDVERYLVQRVKALGGEVRKVQWIGRRGAPDRIVMLPEYLMPCGQNIRRARLIWVELKAPGKPAEAYQLREHERIRKMGQRVEVVDSYARVDEVLS